jgi:hypothetical protein
VFIEVGFDVKFGADFISKLSHVLINNVGKSIYAKFIDDNWQKFLDFLVTACNEFACYGFIKACRNFFRFCGGYCLGDKPDYFLGVF